MSDEERREEEQASRARPRIVDKRVSARRERPPPAGPGVDEVVRPTEARTGATEPVAPATAEPPTTAQTPPPPAEPLTTGLTPPPPSEPSGTPSAGTSTPQPEAGQERIWTPEEEAEAQRIAQEISARPSIEWVLNVAVTLANVAGTKLDLGDPADARLAIDALAAIVNGVGTSLGDAENPLRQTLAQLQLAYAQAVAPPPP